MLPNSISPRPTVCRRVGVTIRRVIRIGAALAVVAMLPVAAPGAYAGDPGSADYQAEIEKWKAYRQGRLTSEEGYLALTGLFWVPGDGRYTFGADSSSDFVFPGHAVPERLGVFVFSGDNITVEIEPDVKVTTGGRAMVRELVYHDHDEQHERTVMSWGTLSWWVIKRGDRFGIRLRDTESPTLKNFKGVRRYPTDATWRIEGRLEKYDPPKYLEIVDIHGNLSRELCAGALVFERDGRSYRLDGVPASDGKEYFVIFGDASNGHDTYSGGRFLYVDAADEDGRVIIDFNKAYSPWCAFSDYTTCQLPPEQNRLPIEVTAGEKDYKPENH